MKRATMALTAVLTASVWAGAAAAVNSGLPAGAHTPAFDVVDVSGPAKGQELCYV